MNRIIISPEVERLATLAVDSAFAVHTELGPGLLESAYQACFAHELGLRGVAYQKELPIPLNYKGVRIEVGFRADIIIEQKLLIELKAVEQLQPIHKAQVITYLKLTHLSLWILINFNETLIKHGIQRVLNIDKS
ncbi:MAG TPA: GxxExxY protein [Candidatus Acidoferrales bacterium]|jgi:GxxExxY protein|nr:GxxExxY protein [Candidatus Acidoferrales bacterium]